MLRIDWQKISPNKKRYYLKIYYANRNITLLDESRYVFLLTVVERCLRHKGALAECGVYKGGSALGISAVVLEKDACRPIHLFDTFDGVFRRFKSRNRFDYLHNFDDYSSEEVSARFSSLCNIQFHRGSIPITLAEVKDKTFSFVHLDLNYYAPTKSALEFFYNHLSDEGIILLDDYGFEMYRDHIKRAVDEFSNECCIEITPVKTGQCLICSSTLEVVY